MYNYWLHCCTCPMFCTLLNYCYCRWRNVKRKQWRRRRQQRLWRRFDRSPPRLTAMMMRITDSTNDDPSNGWGKEDIEHEDENEDWDEQEEEGTYSTYYILVSFLVSLWNFYLHCIAYNWLDQSIHSARPHTSTHFQYPKTQTKIFWKTTAVARYTQMTMTKI